MMPIANRVGDPIRATRMSYTRNPLHPTALYLSEASWSACGSTEAPPLPSSEELSGIERLRVVLPTAMAAPAGWTKIKTTRLGRIATAGERRHLPAGRFSIRAIPRDGQDFRTWIDLNRRLYAVKHLDNPVRVVPDELACRIFAGEDLHPAGLVAAYDCARMMGVSSLRIAEAGFELGWTGCPEDEDPIAVAQLIAATAAIARRAHAMTLGIEVDDTDQALVQSLEYFNVVWLDAFETYEMRLLTTT